MSSLARQTRWGINPGAVTIGNILGGSIGNDIITSKSLTLPDYIFTDGGADKITLAAGHTGADHVAFYAVSNVTFPTDRGIVLSSVASAISEIFPPVAAGRSTAAQPGVFAEPAAISIRQPGLVGCCRRRFVKGHPRRSSPTGLVRASTTQRLLVLYQIRTSWTSLYRLGVGLMYLSVG